MHSEETLCSRKGECREWIPALSNYGISIVSLMS